jgi:hypothetical protein
MAKNREIVPITAPNQNNAPDTLIDAESLEKFISNARDHQLLKKQDVLFSKMTNFFNPVKQAEMYRFLLTKSLGIKDYNFKMKLFFNAATAINMENTTAHLEVKDKAYTEIVTIFNNGLRMKCQPENSTIKSLNWNTLTENVIDSFLQADVHKALELAKLSLTQRTKILLGEDDTSSISVSELIKQKQQNGTFTPNQEAMTAVLQSCHKIAELSHSALDRTLKIEGLAYATELYNMATIFNQPEFRQDALKHLAILHRTLGDNNKAQAFKEEEINILSDNSKIIKKFGQTNAETLQIKEQIKAETLDPIYQAASIGKWTNVQPGRWYIPTEQGVTGYLPLTSDTDYNIKMGLIFESIILAVNNSENHDPTCAIIFAQQYPDIMKYVIEHHPEYFINSDILHLCAEKLDIKELQELTNNNEPAPSGYNPCREKAITPFIEKRLRTDNILQQAKELTTGPWDHNTQGQLLKLFEALTIGNNLGAISDSIKIARMLMIKEVVNAIAKSNSLNFAPFDAICQQYPELIKEIYEYHPEYFSQHKVMFGIAQELVEHGNKVPQVIRQEDHIERDIENEYISIEPEAKNSDHIADLMGQHNILTIEGA